MVYFQEAFHSPGAALPFSQVAAVPAEAKESSALCTHLQVPSVW